MSGVVTVIATFQPKLSRVEEFVELMEAMAMASRGEPGCLRYNFYVDEDGTYFMLEDYVDGLAVEDHRETAHYRDYRARVLEMLVSPISVVVLNPVNVQED